MAFVLRLKDEEDLATSGAGEGKGFPGTRSSTCEGQRQEGACCGRSSEEVRVLAAHGSPVGLRSVDEGLDHGF